MEQTGVAGRVQVSDASYERLKEAFVFEPCQEIHARGVDMTTYLLVGRRQLKVDCNLSAMVVVSVGGGACRRLCLLRLFLYYFSSFVCVCNNINGALSRITFISIL